MPYTLVSPPQEQKKYRLVAPPQNPASVSDAILPFSGPPGNQHFDPNAGLLGMLKRTFSLPGEVYRGELPTQIPDQGTNPELISRAAEAAAVASPVNPAVRSGSRAIEGVARAMRRQKTPVPTSAELNAATDAGYEAARGLGVDYQAPAVARMADIVKANLMREGIHPEDATRTYIKLDKLTKPPPTFDPATGEFLNPGASFTELESARRAFNNIAYDESSSVSNTDRRAARAAIAAIDDFFQNPTPASVLAGPASAVSEVAKAARGNAAAGFRSQDLVNNQASAELKAAIANSGANVDNAIRQRAGYLADPLHPERLAGYSAEEQAAIKQVAEGTVTRNVIRRVGNLFGGGGGLGQLAAIAGGATLGAGAGHATIGALAAPATGLAARKVANALSRRAMTKADELVRRRSPLYRAREAAAPMIPESAATRETILKALLLSQLQRQPSGGGGF
jgi:hypothetical protein